MIDIEVFYRKLETISEDEVVSLLKELENLRAALAYLASCQAATLVSLPKSTSKSSIWRHVKICEIAAAMLEGEEVSTVKHRIQLDDARELCLKAVKKYVPICE